MLIKPEASLNFRAGVLPHCDLVKRGVAALATCSCFLQVSRHGAGSLPSPAQCRAPAQPSGDATPIAEEPAPGWRGKLCFTRTALFVCAS